MTIIQKNEDVFESSQRVALAIAQVYPDAAFCSFNDQKRPFTRHGEMGVGKATPLTDLYSAEDVWAMSELSIGQYLGLVLHQAAAIPGKGHLVVLDVDLKRKQNTTNIAIQKMANWVKQNDALIETSISGKGRHVFLVCHNTDGVLPTYKLEAGQEVEVFGLEGSAGKSVLLSGQDVKGKIIEVPSLRALLLEWGIIEQHELNKPKPAPTHTFDFSPFTKRQLNPTDLDTAISALQAISPNIPHDDWCSLGMALQAEFGDQALGPFISWSSPGSTFPGADAVERKWRSFTKEEGGITLGTLFHMARQNGWNFPDHDKAAVENFPLVIGTQAAPQDPPLGWHELPLNLETLKPVNYLIRGFWAHSFFVLAGQPGVGKTTAVISMAMVMAGLQIGDTPLKTRMPRKTILVTEDSEQVIRTLAAYAKHFRIPTSKLMHWFVVIDAKRSNVRDLLTLAHNVIRHTVDGVRPHLVLDTANSTMEISNENDNSEVGAFIAALKQTIFVQLGTPVTVITHTNKTILRSDSDATARGASAFTGDATLTGILFIEGDTRYMRLTKLRYEPEMREVRFESHVFPEIVMDDHGEAQTLNCRVAIPYPSSEEIRQEEKEKARDEMSAANYADRLQDKVQAVLNYTQAIINKHPEGVILKRGKTRLSIPSEYQSAFILTWAEIYENVPGADRGDLKTQVKDAFYEAFAPGSIDDSWVAIS